MGSTDDIEAPGVGLPLPNADDASVDPAKLREYALNPDHPVGQHKANVFRVALGIELDDWEHLRDAIVENLPASPVTDSREPTDEHGRMTWEVLMRVRGLGSHSDRVLNVITAWEIIDDRPVLETVRVAPKARQNAV